MRRHDGLRAGEAMVRRLLPDASEEEREQAYQDLVKFGRWLLASIRREIENGKTEIRQDGGCGSTISETNQI